ncbi:ribosome recycling factor [Terriglobus saanensis]|uniref:Ribosome-recycling factor n=1 Tax=Terriglobus saanensis (strain ATCC BAA-1853 / DSM 23119 / SP1PR4) TaxID=401053 RepID=E8V3P5_TERSS|nr:ribosome recycling factor [Terriglobus saanensis]ADV84732.1 ribosome recycling factor [Terriglobus saanensis SP1PR4]
MASQMANIPALKELQGQIQTRMNKTVDDFRASLVGVRTGRASVHMLDAIRVDYYGSEMPVNQLATVSTPEATLIVVSPFDPTVVPMIEKAIRNSGQGFNPMHDGKVIRIPIPPMTEERRKEAVKQLASVLEDHKTSIRNIRRDGNDTIKKATKDKLISADDEKRAMEETQAMTDTEIKRVEDLFKAKEKEVLSL